MSDLNSRFEGVTNLEMIIGAAFFTGGTVILELLFLHAFLSSFKLLQGSIVPQSWTLVVTILKIQKARDD